MNLDDVLEKIAQFYPDDMDEDEQQDFCEWWRALDDDLRWDAREKSPMDAMVADIAAYDRRTAYSVVYNTHSGYLHYRNQCAELKRQNKLLESNIRLLNDVMTGRLNYEDQPVQATNGNDGVW